MTNTTIAALTSTTDSAVAIHDMDPISEGRLPEGIRFATRPVDQGQVVEYSWADYDGDLYCRQHDRSDGSTRYYIACGKGSDG